MIIIKKRNLHTVFLLMLIFIFATDFAPLVAEDQRNHLVIFFAAPAVPLILFSQLRVKNDLFWMLIAL